MNALKPRVAALEGARPNATVVQTWRSGASWYRKWSDGFIEQGGLYNDGKNYNRNVVINLNVRYTSRNYTVVGTFFVKDKSYIGYPDFCISLSPDTQNTTSFTTYADDQSYGLYWIACGY